MVHYFDVIFFGFCFQERQISEEEVLDVVEQLVLHPNYTIPLLGCFRKIAKKIVERTVEKLLKGDMVPKLRPDDDTYITEFDEEASFIEDENVNEEEVGKIIDVYMRTGKYLCLHELACLAFCRAIDLIPSLLQ